jgi:hypothetical protein
MVGRSLKAAALLHLPFLLRCPTGGHHAEDLVATAVCRRRGCGGWRICGDRERYTGGGAVNDVDHGTREVVQLPACNSISSSGEPGRV